MNVDGSVLKEWAATKPNIIITITKKKKKTINKE